MSALNTFEWKDALAHDVVHSRRGKNIQKLKKCYNPVMLHFITFARATFYWQVYNYDIPVLCSLKEITNLFNYKWLKNLIITLQSDNEFKSFVVFFFLYKKLIDNFKIESLPLGGKSLHLSLYYKLLTNKHIMLLIQMDYNNKTAKAKETIGNLYLYISNVNVNI